MMISEEPVIMIAIEEIEGEEIKSSSPEAATPTPPWEKPVAGAAGEPSEIAKSESETKSWSPTKE